MSEEKKSLIIHPKYDLKQHFKVYKLERQRVIQLNKSLAIDVTAGNISCPATESLLCHMISDGVIKIRGVEGDIFIERRGNDADKDIKSDLLIYSSNLAEPVKIECKATASKDGITNKSKNNTDNYALVHMNFYKYVVEERYPFIDIRVFYNLNESIKYKTMEGNGQQKIRFATLEDDENTDVQYPDGFNLFNYFVLEQHSFFEFGD